MIAKLIHQLKTNDFIRNNGIFFVGQLAVSAVNYLYYPVLGRLLPTVQFGEVQTLVSLFLEAMIFLNVVTNVAVNIVANEKDNELRNNVIIELERVSTLITIISVVAVLIFVIPLRHFFQFPDVMPFFALGIVLIISAPQALRTAFLRGRSAFGAVSLNNLIGSIGKLIASAILVVIGFGTLGAIGGLIVAQLITLVLSYRQSKKLGLSGRVTKLLQKPDLSLLRPHLKYSLLVLIVSLISTVLFSFDILVVKHYFSPEIAGLYAGVSTIARIIYFLTGSAALVLLSSIKLSAPDAHNRKLLIRSGQLHTLVGGVALLVFVLEPKFIISALIGSKYLSYAYLLAPLSIALFVLATMNLLLSYDLALRRWSAAFIALFGAATIGILILLSHGTPKAVVMSLLYGSLIMLGMRALDSVRRRI